MKVQDKKVREGLCWYSNSRWECSDAKLFTNSDPIIQDMEIGLGFYGNTFRLKQINLNSM